MRLHTCSEVISLAKELEGKTASFYQSLAQQYVNNQDLFLSFSKENERNAKDIQRVYYGVISDAIEGCFAFNIETDDYALKVDIQNGAARADVLKQAAEIEKTVVKFYSDAAEQSKSLMADVPRAFIMIARKRQSRIDKLGSLLKS